MKRFTLFFYSGLFLLASAAHSQDYYDELRDSSGNLRPHYQKVMKVIENRFKGDKNRKLKQFLKKTQDDFKGDNALYPIPRLITQNEFNTLKKGVELRGNALRMFLQDHYSGKKTYRDKVIPGEVIDRILARTGENAFDGHLSPDQIAFPYGPDIIRNAQGKWVVLEDNPGYIGGIGDLEIAQNSLFKHMPELKEATGVVNDPLEYYEKVIERARERAYPKNGAIVLLQTPPYPDAEDIRIRKLYKKFGVRTITPNTVDQIVVKEDGVYIRSRDALSKNGLDRVGFLFLGAEHQYIDPKNSLVQNLTDREFSGFKSFSRGIIDHILKRNVATNYAPGLDFIGDKEFYLYVDELVRFYMKTEPIITNLKTERLDSPEVFKRIFEQGGYKNSVIKVVDGRGGDGIYIGPKMTAADVKAAMKAVQAEPHRYIVQSFNHLSVLDGHLVDIRMISDVSPKDVYVSTTPWGRGLPVEGDGKVNLSLNGREFTIIVTRFGCESQLYPQ